MIDHTGVWNLLIVDPLINALVVLYDLLFSDFGLAIVALTVAIRLALYPLFLAQLRSQRVMQELQPAIAELKRKYKDRQKFAEEQMKLYRERRYNPASGCLPLVVQMPILFGLYSALQQVGCGLGQGVGGLCPGLAHDDLQRILYSFVPNPVPAGGTFDTTAHWLPWITQGLAQADPLHILPIVAGVVQLLASLMTMPVKTPQTDDPMQRSMQGMAYYFPVITVVFAWSLPSGLAVYWIATTLFSIVQQYLVSGWGKLAVYAPFLARLPSPSAALMRREELAAVREVDADPAKDEAADGNVTQERRRRRRRR